MRLRTRPRQRLTLVVACTAQVMIVLDVMIVSVALPSLQRELHLSPAGLEWVVSAYALALAALIPAGGALGDHFGRKRVFMGGVALFMLASVGCALSVSGGMLIGFRVIQGIGGAVMSSLTLSLITEAYPPEARTGPIGLWAAVSGLAVAGGSVIGGLLLSVFPWSSIFWVNVPIAVVTLVISWFAVVESREPVPRPFDTAGVALSASGLLFLTFGFVDSSDATWHSPVVAASVAAGVAALVVFFVWEHRAAFPWSRRRCCEPRASAGPVPCTCWPTSRSRDSSTTSPSSSRMLTDGPRCAPACPGFSFASRTLPWPSSASGSSGGCRWHRPSGGGASSPPRACLA
jgi:MFS family permease